MSDYQTIRLSLKAHPMGFLREHYAARGFITADQLKAIRDGKRISIAGPGADPPAAGKRQGRLLHHAGG